MRIPMAKIEFVMSDEQRGHGAGQDTYHACKAPEAPPGSPEWQKGFMKGWMFAALSEQEVEYNFQT